MKRWQMGLAAALGAGALAALYAVRIERTHITLDHFTLEIDAALPATGLTILHLSDFHFHSDGAVQAAKIDRLQALLETEHYDVVALTGDLIHDIDGLPGALALIDALHPRLAAYFVPGNHDYAEYTPWGVFGHTWRESTEESPSVRDLKQVAAAFGAFVRKVVRNDLVRMPVAFNDMAAIVRRLEAAHVIPLINTSAHLSVDGVDVWLAGVDDAMESTPNLAAALERVPPHAALILLAHNPDIWLQCGVDRADLVLSGHTHGGQIQLPGIGAIHTQGTHLQRKQPAGWFTRGKTRMFVSRGVGESIPLRFNAGPQAAMITLVTRPKKR